MSRERRRQSLLVSFFLSERAMMTVILINAVVIFLMYFPDFHNNWLLKRLDELIIVIFIIEAIVKLSVLGARMYFSNAWNRFDFFIVVASLPSLLVNFINIPDTSLLLILRLFRLLRLIRFINFVPHIGKIIAGLTRAIKASVFVLMALLFLNFLLAIFTCHFYADLAPKYFGDPLLSAYSIFQMFTVEGWNEIPAYIADKMDNPFFEWITRLYFVIIVLIGGIFGMSLANAVFVDEMTVDNNETLEKKIDVLQQQIEEIRNMLNERNTQ